MEKDVRIIIAGGRKFNDYEAFKNCMSEWLKHHKFNKDDKITEVCGCADGVDLLGKKYAEEVGWDVKLFPANWNFLGKAAGILRNGEMANFADGGDEKYLIAIWNGKSRGTKNMIDTAIQHGIQIHIFSYGDTEQNAVKEYIDNLMSDVFGACMPNISKKEKEMYNNVDVTTSDTSVPEKVDIEITTF